MPRVRSLISKPRSVGRKSLPLEVLAFLAVRELLSPE